MNTREDFEAWAEDHAFVFERSTIPGRTYVYFNTEVAWKAYQAATSRQESKVKALVEALELVSPAEKSALDRAYVNGNATAALTNYAATKETP